MGDSREFELNGMIVLREIRDLLKKLVERTAPDIPLFSAETTSGAPCSTKNSGPVVFNVEVPCAIPAAPNSCNRFIYGAGCFGCEQYIGRLRRKILVGQRLRGGHNS